MRTILSTKQDIERATKYVSGLKANGARRWVFEVKVYRPPRSNQQNRMYWAWLNLIGQETGQSPEDLHEYLKRKFLPARTIKVGRSEMKIPGTTRLLDTKEFTKYLDSVSLWAAEFLGVLCPQSGDLGFDTMFVQYGSDQQ